MILEIFYRGLLEGLNHMICASSSKRRKKKKKIKQIEKLRIRNS
jgi:hypothetical protein